jgi:hypothetical protein
LLCCSPFFFGGARKQGGLYRGDWRGVERGFRRDIWGPCVILDTLYFFFRVYAGLGSILSGLVILKKNYLVWRPYI